MKYSKYQRVFFLSYFMSALFDVCYKAQYNDLFRNEKLTEIICTTIKV